MRDPDSELKDLQTQGLLRQLRVLEGEQGSRIQLKDGSQLHNFSSNDYLGLTNNDSLKSIYQHSIDRYGVGSGASRLICGTMQPHQQLESKIAELKGAEAALTFSSGFATATGTIPAIVGKDDIVILDKLCHASLIDGARLSGATIRVFPHNNLEKLEQQLRRAVEKSDGSNRILVITESVFSMDGDLAPLAEITQLKQNYEFLLLVDEAHGFGVLGPHGRGLAAELNVEADIDFQMGTFSKAVGMSGGYLAASDCWVKLLINRARSFIYSTAPAPALANTLTEAITIVSGPEGDQLRITLAENQSALSTEAITPIIPQIVGSNEAALERSTALLKQGFLVPAIRYPTVPKGTARLRITVSAAHAKDDVLALKALL